MASVDTSFGFSLGLPQAISVTGSSQTQIVVPAFSYNSGSPVPSPALTAGSPLYIQVPPDVAVGSTSFDGHPFKVRFAGVVTTGASATFQPEIYLGNSSTIGSNVQIAAPTAVTVNTTSAAFEVEANLMWSSASKAVTGSFSSLIGSTFAGSAALSNAGSSIAETGLVFTFTVTFGTANAANSVQITELTITRA